MVKLKKHKVTVVTSFCSQDDAANIPRRHVLQHVHAALRDWESGKDEGIVSIATDIQPVEGEVYEVLAKQDRMLSYDVVLHVTAESEEAARSLVEMTQGIAGSDVAIVNVRRAKLDDDGHVISPLKLKS